MDNNYVYKRRRHVHFLHTQFISYKKRLNNEQKKMEEKKSHEKFSFLNDNSTTPIPGYVFLCYVILHTHTLYLYSKHYCDGNIMMESLNFRSTYYNNFSFMFFVCVLNITEDMFYINLTKNISSRRKERQSVYLMYIFNAH